MAGTHRQNAPMSSQAKGVVAAGHRLTGEAAVNVLREGGTAIDAAIAALAMACVCEPILSSPGGGGFAMLRDGASGKVSLIDFFPHTPRQQRQSGDSGIRETLANFGTAAQVFHIGPATTGAPGFCAGLENMHAHGARFCLSDLFQPAVYMARAGFTMTPYQYFLSTVIEPILTASPAGTELFAPGGILRKVGETFKNPGLAEALEILAKDGFAESAVGEAVLEEQADYGHLKAEDLVSYEVFERNAIRLQVADALVHLNPLPAASGVLIAHSLAQLETPDAVGSALALFATGEARRQAKGDLSWLAGTPFRQKGTTHISIIDASANACAVTISNGEGNGDLVKPFGFMPNNILGEEDVNPAGAAGWPVNSRLASMMCPCIIEQKDGGLIVLGSGGSNRIRSAIFQIIIHTCLKGLTLKEAVQAPRLHVEGGQLDFEDLLEAETRSKLCALFPDHRAWPEPNMFFGGVHAVRRDEDGTLSGIGDVRRDGIALIAK